MFAKLILKKQNLIKAKRNSLVQNVKCQPAGGINKFTLTFKTVKNINI